MRATYRAVPDAAFPIVATRHPWSDAEALADLIDADGRVRIELELEVSIGRYVRAVPEMAGWPVPLDAAIEFTLRSAVARGIGEADAATRLKARYPQFASAIDAARQVGQALDVTRAPGGGGGGAGGWTAGGSRLLTSPTGTNAQAKLPLDVGPLSIMGKPRYKLVRKLGAGSQGTAFLAEDRQLSTQGQPAWVCVKMLGSDPTRADAGPEVGEAAKARRINHPSVVRVLDRGVFHGSEYIVYEFIEARGLSEWIDARGKPLTAREAVRLIVSVCRGVQAAHAASVVHRDLKPDNILMTTAGEPKITDFGAAALIDPGAALRASGMGGAGGAGQGPVGNLAFMAPEQFWMSRGAVAPTADLYALGGLLWWLLTRELPNGSTEEEVRRRHTGMSESPAGAEAAAAPAASGSVDATPRPANMDPDLFAICRRALAGNIHQRHSSADSLAADLESWLNHRPVEWTRPSWSRRVRLAVRRQPLLAALFVVLGVLGAVTGYLVHLLVG